LTEPEAPARQPLEIPEEAQQGEPRQGFGSALDSYVQSHQRFQRRRWRPACPQPGV